ncbi:MAG: PLD nuclease N-terminal domain-containing protein [Verrucomicrobiales bacterium]|jgi:hypothetical protein|nr:PLD nuclease N-terminal domain-containing protein [Verrucomicrobiales bacterium]
MTSETFITVVIALFVFWFATLVVVLSRKNWNGDDRVVWTVVICTLNILGAILYLLIGPKDPGAQGLSEDELKERCNNNTLKNRD